MEFDNSSRMDSENHIPVNPSPLAEGQSVARGRDTRTALFQRLKPFPLVHSWDFWYEKPPGQTPIQPKAETSPASATQAAPYQSQLTLLHSISDVGGFWSVWNNFNFAAVPYRESCHLFHTTVKPVWEDQRNERGGAWSFRVPAETAIAFFQDVCLLAIGEQLQEAIKDDTKLTFKDDICGISFSPRNNATSVISIWNRDGANEAGIRKLLEAVLESAEADRKPRDGSYSYKKHADRAGFTPIKHAGDSGTPSSGIETRPPLFGRSSTFDTPSNAVEPSIVEPPAQTQ